MAQSYFQFKQFRIEQDRCGMKVSTDACIQGAWSAKIWQELPGNRILDIGTGTGLLSLMLAQVLRKSHLLAIEPEADACEQAGENFDSSPWCNRIELRNTDLQDLAGSGAYEGAFDFIVCNPPFFEHQLNAGDSKRNNARHDALPMKQLAGLGIRLIKSGGILSVLYPEREWQAWLTCAEAAGWQLCQELLILPHAGKASNRRVGLFSNTSETIIQKASETLTIHGAPGYYTPAFTALLRPYYLFL